MRRVGVNVHNIMTNVIVEEGNEANIPIIDNVIAKQKP